MPRLLLFALLVGLCAGSLPWLRVRPIDKALYPASPRDYVIADEWGREVTLRGACVESEERNFPPWQRPTDPAAYANGRCPNNTGEYQEPPICGVEAGNGKFNQSTADLSLNDFAQARALGFNIMRLCLSWSELEYTPGEYNASYIERVAQMVEWAAEQDIYVILDMHEDLYTLFIQPPPNATGVPPFLTPGGGQDGAPAWAVATDGWPPLSIFGIGNLNLAIMRAFDNFYQNKVVPGVPQGAAPGPGLQDHYIGAIAALARRFINSSNVAGLEIINEPNPGSTLGPLDFGRNYLYPLYTRTVQAITGVRDGLPPCNASTTPFLPVGPPACPYPDLGIHDTRHIFFAEPSALRNELDFSSEEIPGPWTTYAHVVHTPHVYTHVFTIDQEIPALNLSGKWPPSWAFAYDTAQAEANRMRSGVFVTEFGTGADSDVKTVQPTLDQAELHGVGGTIWSWKSGCGTDPSNPGCYSNDSWTLYAPAAAPRGNPSAPIPPNAYLYPHRERMLSRVHSRGTLGECLGYFYNVSDRSFVLRANASAAGAGDAARARAGWARAVALALGGGGGMGPRRAQRRRGCQWQRHGALPPPQHFASLCKCHRGGGRGGAPGHTAVARWLPQRLFFPHGAGRVHAGRAALAASGGGGAGAAPGGGRLPAPAPAGRGARAAGRARGAGSAGSRAGQWHRPGGAAHAGRPGGGPAPGAHRGQGHCGEAARAHCKGRRCRRVPSRVVASFCKCQVANFIYIYNERPGPLRQWSIAW